METVENINHFKYKTEMIKSLCTSAVHTQIVQENGLQERILLKTGGNMRHFLFRCCNSNSDLHPVLLRYTVMNRHQQWVSVTDTFSYARKCYSLIYEA
jgi:hypothetical protein